MSAASAQTGKPALHKNVRLEITQADIDNGVRYASQKCMIALAARRAIGDGVASLRVYSGHVVAHEVIEDDKARGVALKPVAWSLTDAAIKRIKQFDRGEAVKPFVTIIRGV